MDLSLTILAVIGPISEGRQKVRFAETRHKWNLPEYRLHPKAADVDLEFAFHIIIGDWNVFDLDLFWSKTIGG